MSRWQPIESAPTDGTSLWLFYPPQPGAPANGFTGGGQIEGWWCEDDDGWESIIGTIGDPTYWMNLPDPPGA